MTDTYCPYNNGVHALAYQELYWRPKNASLYWQSQISQMFVVAENGQHKNHTTTTATTNV